MIETARLVLREFRDSDLADIEEYAGDPEVVRYLPWGPNTLEQTRNSSQGFKRPGRTMSLLSNSKRRSAWLELAGSR